MLIEQFQLLRVKFASFLADMEGLRKFANHCRIVTRYYLMLPLVFVGFILNPLIVVVLGCDKTMNGTTRFLLQMLSLGDIMFYVLFPLFGVARRTHLVVFIMSASETIASWMPVVLTYQRYVAVSRPLHTRQYVTMSRARAAIAAVWFFPIITYLLVFCIRFTINMGFALYVLRIVRIVTTFLLPMSVTLFLNIRLIVVMRKSSASLRQQLMTPGGDSDSRIASSHGRVTLTLIIIVTVYLVCRMPITTVQIFIMIRRSFMSDLSLSCHYYRVKHRIGVANSTS
jgi:hypothetical protein